MSEAPEQIWINKIHGRHPEDWSFSVGAWETQSQLKEKVKYIRADHVDAMLKAEAEALRAIALDYRHILHSAKAGRDLYCGSYVAKEYHFTRDQIDAALLKIEQALKDYPAG